MSLFMRALQRHGPRIGLLFSAIIAFREPLFAADHPNQNDQKKLSSLRQKIEELDRAGKYREAIPFAQDALKFAESTMGSEVPETGAACSQLGDLYRENGEYAKAKPLFQRALKIDEKALGPEHPYTGTIVNNLAVLYYSMGDYAKAEPLYQRALKICEKALGPDHPETAMKINNLAVLYYDMGAYAKAEPLHQRALKAREKALGPEHPDTVMSLNNLALLYDRMGEYAKAEPLYQRALRIRQKVLGLEHPYTAQGLNNLAKLYEDMGEYAKAELLYERSLKIYEKALGREHPDTANSLSNLAVLYQSIGDYAKAKPLFERALKIRQKALGPEHPDTATSLNTLARLYCDAGDYAKAEPLLQHALKIREKVLGLQHLSTATSLNHLAVLYEEMGDHAKAEPLFQRVLRINEKAFGPGHPDTADSLNNLAQLYVNLGDYAKSEPLFERALKIREKALGAEHPDTADSLNDLGGRYCEMGDYAKAEPLFRRALKIYEKALGPEHPNTARSLNNLARLCCYVGDYAKAEPLYQRALKIRQKSLGPEHPDTAASLHDIALFYIAVGDPEEGLRFAVRARHAQERNLSIILSFTAEQQRLAFQKATNPYTLPATLGNAPELAEAVLRQKAVVLDSLLEDRLIAEASSDPKQREITEQLRAAKQRLMQLMLEVPKDSSEAAQKKRVTEKERLSAEVEQMEAGLARQVAGLGKARRALTVTVQQVQSALPPQTALIELLRYSHYLEKRNYERRYGAVVIGESGEPSWVPLGNAAEIAKNVGLYQKSVRGKTDEAALSRVLAVLNNQVWAPIEKALPAGTTTVVVSPDAELSFVSFATLLAADDRFVGEKYSIRYAASGRDLLREVKAPAGPKTTMRVFANPDFVLNSTTKSAEKTNETVLRSVEMRDLENLSLPNLPGTEKESSALEARARQSGWQPEVILGANATEAELRKMNSPRILHLATHGFFLPEVDLGLPPNVLSRTAADIPKGKLVNPMHRSGLALAGAQTTLHAWAKGEVPPTENDGIVTAEEVGGLKLNETWLVVLSACDTGSGEAKAGEGVMGLRRGFVQAGTQNLLMTLWPISDETTVNIMLDFYDAAFKTGNAPQALADTQRDWLVKLRKEKGLLAAVRLAGPFIISSQGKQ
jgi:tetratricopeptide (TPR) repeat protein